MKNILERVIQDDSFNENIDNIVENNLDSSSLKNNLTLQKELQMQIQQDMKTYNINTKKEKDFEEILKKEMTAYESERVQGKYLSSIHEDLLTIKLTSVEAERAFSFIVGGDGVVGLTYEHSPAEGPPITRMMDHISDYLDRTRGNKWLPSTSVEEPIKLRFKLSDETMKDIEEAENDLQSLLDDLEMSCFTFETYGKDFIKSQKLSPDSYIQMAIQLAFYKIHNQIAATYESASSRKFLNGRTETIRSASMEALDFCKQMVDKSSVPHTKAAALRSAVDAHKEYTLQAVNGMGIDRMLLGLKKIALECGMNVPDFYMDGGYTASTHFKLSTSQVPSKIDAFMCYGPLVPDGYGCCYNPRESSINFGLSACNSSPETHSSNFMKALTESLSEMHDILNLSQKSKL
ncbi:Carnitine O-acetyltransferase [Araneus ventricosus]|uniref:Carnitine O-acetyltransferase n=1 Tax=Araneus ventricosus TaxID=182803 RepID=A0A4Y2C231_ARAVE|nr:Carnitine O-acetyltransferase [Araneus ventricosus]